jgi:hypothetical protein
MLRRCFLHQARHGFVEDVKGEGEEAQPRNPETQSFRSQLSTSASTDILQSNVAPDATSMKLSIPKPTREILPAITPAAMPINPSRLFQRNREIFQPLSAIGHRVPSNRRVTHPPRIPSDPRRLHRGIATGSLFDRDLFFRSQDAAPEGPFFHQHEENWNQNQDVNR